VQDRAKVPGLEAVVKAARSLGSNGRGRGGVGGYIFAMASQNPKRFAKLLENALEQKNSAWGGGDAVLSDEQLMKRIEKMSVNEIVMEHAIHLVAPPLDDPPSSATDVVEPIIDAARRHGSNGRGKGGVEGYIRMLAQIECKSFDKWIIRAMDEQVKGRSPQSIEEVKRRLRERGVDEKKVYDLAHVMKYGRLLHDKESSKRGTELEEGLRQARQYFNSLRHANQNSNRESPEANPAGLDPEGHDHDDHRGKSEQQ
jgi:hypothetical protein